MHPYLLFLIAGLFVVLPRLAAQEAPEAAAAPSPVATVSPEKAPAAEAAATPAPVDAVAHDAKTVETEKVPVTATTEPAQAPVVPVTAPRAASETSAITPGVAPAATPPVVARVDSQAELLAARVDLIQQMYSEQRDREMTLLRDTIRLVTILGGSFAGVCMVGLLAAAFLNYRALMAVQGIYARATPAAAPEPANGMLPAPGVPGIERVQASGQRFQSRMSGLEQRLAELENLAGREPPAVDASLSRDGAYSPTVEETGLAAPPVQVVPRAMILVHKAQALGNLGKLTEALATLDEAAAIDGAKTEVNLARGQILEKLGRLGDALKAYDSAVVADDHNTSALLLKAGVLNRQERFSEALACYERALEVHRTAV